MPGKNTVTPIVGNTELTKLLSEKELRKKAILALEDCLDAKMTMKNDEGKIVEYTDFRTILGAVQTILNYTDGRPVERREVITRKVTTLDELREKSQKSPELRAAIEELLREEKTVVQVAPKSKSDISHSESTM